MCRVTGLICWYPHTRLVCFRVGAGAGEWSDGAAGSPREGKKVEEAARAPSSIGFWTHPKDSGMRGSREGGHDKTKMKIRSRSDGIMPTSYWEDKLSVLENEEGGVESG